MSTRETSEDENCSRPASLTGADASGESLRQLSIAEIARLLDSLEPGDPTPWAALGSDPRAGVRRLAARRRRRMALMTAEEARLERMLQFEHRYWGQGVTRIAGVDEVGRGCLAGPVVAAAVVLPPQTRIRGLNDSKKLTPARREALDVEIRTRAQGVAIAQIEAEEIDRINILQAALKAMRAALLRLPEPPELVLVDGRIKPGGRVPETAIVNGDARSLSIAAASVVAKVYRDRLMVEQASVFSEYSFQRNKGYGSQEHLRALGKHGPCPLHRHSFAPVARVLDAQQGDLGEEYWIRLKRCHDEEELDRTARAVRDVAGRLSAVDLDRLRREYVRTRERLRRTGERGEEAAARYLSARGYQVLERRYRAAGGEIDIIANDGQETVFVEVKATRGRPMGCPADRVGVDKRTRVARAARHFLARQNACHSSRFDVMVVDLEKDPPVIEHLADAWRPNR